MNDAELIETLERAIADYRGQGDVLRNAVGSAILSKSLGWRVVKIMYGATVYKKYQKITGINFEEAFPEETALSRKVIGYRIWKETNRFWDVVTNRIRIPEGKATFQ